MSSPSPVPDVAGPVRSDSAASTRDSTNALAEFTSQAILLLQNADPRTVVTTLLKEKSYLHTQNGQLWRLVDRQRTALLDLQKDYQKVLADKNKYQARLKTLRQQDGARGSDRNSTSTEMSVPIVDPEAPQDANRSPSRRSSGRSVRPMRSPQPGAQLEALQASLEEEIKRNNERESALEPSQTIVVRKTVPPALVLNTSDQPPSSSKLKKVPTPLNLSPNIPLPPDGTPRSALAIPGGLPEMRNGRLSPFRDPPPSAPPYQTSASRNLFPSPRNTPPTSLSPNLSKNPSPITPTLIPLTPMSGKIIYDESEPRTEDSRPPSSPRTSKPPTDTEESTDASSSPTTTGPISPRDALIETSRKSPLVPRRSRMPSHRSQHSASHTSTSSITTINGPTPSGRTSPVVTRVARSMSFEQKEPIPRNLMPPSEYTERRRSRSFDDLQALASDQAQMQKEEKRRTPALPGIGLDDVISEMLRENEEAKQTAAREGKKMVEETATPERPARASLGLPMSPKLPMSPLSSRQSLTMFAQRARAASNASRPLTLAINPNDISSILLSVLSLRSRPITTAQGPTEETLYTIRCRAKNPVDKSGDKEILRVEKSYATLVELGDKLSGIVGMASFLNTFFDDFPIERSNQRKAVDYFFKVILGSQLDDRALLMLAEFLSNDIVQKHDSQIGIQSTSSSPIDGKSPTRPNIPNAGDAPPTKEGYLTKRGKNFGGWQSRYFALDGPQLKYYDAPNGVHLGSIKLPQAQIGRQNSHSQMDTEESSGDEQMKYAFLILEPKRNDATKMVRHVLCSQSDEDRDEWINALLYYVSFDPGPSGPTMGEKVSRGKKLQRRQQDQDTLTTSVTPTEPTASSSDNQQSESDIIGMRYDQMAPGKRPTTISSNSEVNRQSTWSQGSQDDSRGVDNRLGRTPQPMPTVPQRSPYRTPISGPMNGTPIIDDTIWNSAQREEDRRREEKRAKKRSVWGFLNNRGRATPENVQPTAPPPPALLQHGLFGIPLREAVDITREMGMGINVPSVVYRCIEYLEHKDAATEEGIYRLSGSNSAIRMLKDRFNTDGDFDLVNSKDYHDVHAVAGLLKLYLRELPSTVLTRERHVDFLHIVDIEDKTARVRRLSELVRGLPKVNYELLRIMSKHLRRIVRRAQENKMTIRNVGIVFSPTLNIPAPVFSLFITEYEIVFDEPDEPPTTSTPPSAPESQSFVVYESNNNPLPPTSKLNNHLSVQDTTSHRRYHSADPSIRPPVPPSSFPMLNQGYHDSERPQGYQQPHYQHQQSYQSQSYQQYPSHQSGYHGKWDSPQDESDLFS